MIQYDAMNGNELMDGIQLERIRQQRDQVSPPGAHQGLLGAAGMVL